MMTKPGAARPIVIPTHGELSHDVLHSSLRTLGITKAQLEELIRES